jgi:hypothetical protein
VSAEPKCGFLLMQRGPSWVSWLPVFFFFHVVVNQLAREHENDVQCKWTHNVYVTKFVEPKVINRVGRSHKVTFSELLVGLRGGYVELV